MILGAGNGHWGSSENPDMPRTDMAWHCTLLVASGFCMGWAIARTLRSGAPLKKLPPLSTEMAHTCRRKGGGRPDGCPWGFLILDS